MGEMRKLIITVLVISMFATGLGLIVTDMYDKAGTDIEPQFQRAYGNLSASLEDSRQLGEEIQRKTRQSEPSESSATVLVVKSSWESLKFVFKSVTIGISMLAVGGGALGLPEWFTGGIITMLLVSASFMLWSAVFRRKT